MEEKDGSLPTQETYPDVQKLVTEGDALKPVQPSFIGVGAGMNPAPPFYPAMFMTVYAGPDVMSRGVFAPPVRAVPPREQDDAEKAAPVAGPGEKTCPACGAVLPADARFCHECGALQRRFCPHCGAACGEKDAFCADCGEKLV